MKKMQMTNGLEAHQSFAFYCFFFSFYSSPTVTLQSSITLIGNTIIVDVPEKVSCGQFQIFSELCDVAKRSRSENLDVHPFLSEVRHRLNATASASQTQSFH